MLSLIYYCQMNPFLEIFYGFFLPPVYLIHLPFRKLQIKQKLFRCLLVAVSPSTWIFIICLIYFDQAYAVFFDRQDDSLTSQQIAENNITQNSIETSEDEEYVDEVTQNEPAVPFEGYSQGTLNWKGYPEPLSSEVLEDFYWTLFLNGVSAFYTPEEEGNADAETIELVGNTFQSFIYGAYGLIYYSGMQSAVHDFNYKRGRDTELQDDDFWDLSYASEFIGLPLFDDAKQKELQVDFACYNKQTVKWLFDNMVPAPDMEIDGYKFQKIYDVIGARYFHLMIESYLHLKKEGLSHNVNRFVTNMKTTGFDGQEYLSNSFRHDLDEYRVNHEYGNFTYLSPEVAFGYWLRRLVDGSAGELLAGYIKIAKLYDQKWLEETVEKYGYEELDLLPGDEASTIWHVSRAFPEEPVNRMSSILKDTARFDLEHQLDEDGLYKALSWLSTVNEYETEEVFNFPQPDYHKSPCFLGGRYRTGDFEFFPYAFSGESSCWFTSVFIGDKMLEKPILLNALYEGPDYTVFYYSDIEIESANKLAIKGTRTTSYHSGAEQEVQTFEEVLFTDDKRFKLTNELL